MVFFFQAEDGIRDIGVTGVQTCALPICVQFEFAYCLFALFDFLRQRALSFVAFLLLISLSFATNSGFFTIVWFSILGFDTEAARR